jgi:uncharacterized protein (TIGR02246 family)
MSVTVSSVSAADVAAIESVSEQFRQALLRRDFDAVSALYTADAVLMPPHHPAVQGGPQAIKAWIAAFPKVTEFNLTIDRVDGRADLAYVRGTYTMTIHPEGAPAPISDRGKYLEIRRRQPDGTWLLEADTFNSDLP